MSNLRVPSPAAFADLVRLAVRRAIATAHADGIAAADVAARAGVPRPTLYRWRNGAEMPTVGQFAALRAR